MGTYSERPDIKEQNMKRETVDAAIELFGWPTMYRTLREHGAVLRIRHRDWPDEIVTLRASTHPIVPGWKLAAYDALFTSSVKEEP